MKEFFLIFIGSGLGGLSRFGLSRWIDNLLPYHFPYGTLMVNIVACFILGIIVGITDHKLIISPLAKLFLTVGFCGGFSTFSTFSYETLVLYQQGHILSSFLYIVASMLLCVAATFGGQLIALKI